MITTCTVCQARYQLEDEKVPRRVIRVRCPACSGVFSLDGSKRAEHAAAPAPERLQGLESGFPASPPPVAQAAPAPAPRPVVEPVRAAATPAPEPRAAAAPAAKPAAPAARTVAVAEPEPPAGSAPRRRRSKEEMLARALVSDILVYNRDQRDAALAQRQPAGGPRGGDQEVLGALQGEGGSGGGQQHQPLPRGAERDPGRGREGLLDSPAAMDEGRGPRGDRALSRARMPA